MRDYVPAMEKMAANGYENSLVDAPDFTTGVRFLSPSGDLVVKVVRDIHPIQNLGLIDQNCIY